MLEAWHLALDVVADGEVDVREVLLRLNRLGPGFRHLPLRYSLDRRRSGVGIDLATATGPSLDHAKRNGNRPRLVHTALLAKVVRDVLDIVGKVKSPLLPQSVRTYWLRRRRLDQGIRSEVHLWHF